MGGGLPALASLQEAWLSPGLRGGSWHHPPQAGAQHVPENQLGVTTRQESNHFGFVTVSLRSSQGFGAYAD